MGQSGKKKDNTKKKIVAQEIYNFSLGRNVVKFLYGILRNQMICVVPRKIKREQYQLEHIREPTCVWVVRRVAALPTHQNLNSRFKTLVF
jgi:hypothetical protein